MKAGVFHAGGDRLASAMNEDGIDAGRFEKNNITQEFVDDLLILHRGPTVFDDEGLAAIFLNVGKRLDQAFGANFGCGEHGFIRRDSVAHILR